MFRRYRNLRKRLHEAEEEIEDLYNSLVQVSISITELRNDNSGVLYGFAEDIDEIKTMLSDYGDLVREQREAYIEQARRDIGFQNMINY